MTIAQDESRAENWALFQLRSMRSNMAALHRANVDDLYKRILLEAITNCEEHIQQKQKARMLVKEYYEKHPKIKVWCNELLDNKDIPK